MLEKLFKFEAGLLRVETWLLVSCVLLMLVLAGYTVFYRNVLIPWQNHLSTSGPPVSQTVDDSDDGVNEGGAEDDGFGGGFGDAEETDGDEADGFGGGFGAEDEEAQEDEAGGFGGGFGADDEEETGDAEETDQDQADRFGGGFGGGFDEEEVDDAGQPDAGEPDEPDEPDEPGGEASQAAADPETDGEPVGGPPPEGSLAAWVVELIDTLKAHWTDELLRQLVIICGFLGAMLAARQRNHITIDAVGTLLEGRPRHVVDTLTSVVAGVVCVFLAVSGMRLVELGIEFPRQLLPFAKEWHLQLAFPIGWGLLAFHFMVRGVESAHFVRTFEDEPPATDVPVGVAPENLDQTKTATEPTGEDST